MNWFKGKRTYITGTIMVLGAAKMALGVVEGEAVDWNAVMEMAGTGLGLIFLRSGVKAAPQ
jgi:hypothetical protein